MNLQSAAIQGLRRYAVFTGRTSRAEYWYLMLAFVLALIGASIVDGVTGLPLFTPVAIFGSFLPLVTATVRRLHDTGRSGHWYWLSLVPFAGLVVFVFVLEEGQAHPNAYGPPTSAMPVSLGYGVLPPPQPGTAVPLPSLRVAPVASEPLGLSAASLPDPIAAVAPALPVRDPAPAPQVEAELRPKPRLALRFEGQPDVVVHGPVVLGRAPAPREDAPGAQLVVLPDPARSLSRDHVLVVPSDDGNALMVRDLGSTNGTLILDGDATSRRLAAGRTGLATLGSSVLLAGDVELLVVPAGDLGSP
jgi:uncharacterized membrane protein YhaH (DUF805 family)